MWSNYNNPHQITSRQYWVIAQAINFPEKKTIKKKEREKNNNN